MDNTSGQGATATVPAEIDRWNWGAFLLNWIWGIGNNTFIALLMFIPVVNFIMPFVLGAKGSAWAWRNRQWMSVEHFKTVQRQWAKWGVIVVTVAIAAAVVLVFVAAAWIKSTDAFQLSLAKLEASQEVIELIGAPFSTGFPMGNIQVSGPGGHANLSFSISGPKGEGKVFMEASRDMGRWQIDRLILQQQESGHRIDLNP